MKTATTKEDTVTTQTAVFATDHEHKTYRLTDPASYDQSLNAWLELDKLHRAGRLPQTRHFEVRTVWLDEAGNVRSHDRYDTAKLDLHGDYAQPVLAGSRGHKYAGPAARKAWKLFAPTYHRRGWDAAGERTGQQGLGGWYYHRNGQTVAQGLDHLARVCLKMRLVVKGGDGRWYPLEPREL